MRREDVKGIFPDATDEQIDAILNSYHADTNTAKKELKTNEATLGSLKEQLSTTNSELAKYKQIADELQVKVEKSMSAEELLAQREQEAAQKEQEYAIRVNTLDAREIFQKAGLSVDDCDGLISQVVSADADKTKALAQQIADLTVKQRELVEKQTKDDLVKSNPKPEGAGTTNTSISKDDFLKLTTNEQLKMMDDNPNILAELN
jgi:septal ring factor EnvC (AmiA/AmiB activator)